MTDPLDWNLTEHDATMLREMPSPIYMDGPEPESDEPDEIRRWGLRICMDDLIFALTECDQYPTMPLDELLARKVLTLEMAWEICKAGWLETCGHEPHGLAN